MKSTLQIMAVATLSLVAGTVIYFAVQSSPDWKDCFTRSFFQFTTGAYLMFLVWFFGGRVLVTEKLYWPL